MHIEEGNDTVNPINDIALLGKELSFQEIQLLIKYKSPLFVNSLPPSWDSVCYIFKLFKLSFDYEHLNAN